MSRILVLVAACLLLVAACGKKADLRIPPEPAEEQEEDSDSGD